MSTQSKVRCRWEFHSSMPKIAAMHVDDELFHSIIDDETVKSLRETITRMVGEPVTTNMPELTGTQKELIDALRMIRGIKWVGIVPGEVRLERSLLYQWHEIIHLVQAAVSEYLAADLDLREAYYCGCRGCDADD